MSVATPNGPINAENADNFEDIEKQFAVKGKSSSSAAAAAQPSRELTHGAQLFST
jgi:hypothetical protein